MAIQKVAIVNNQVQVALQGSIYVEESAEIMGKFVDMIGEGYTSFLVDLSDVDYIDSAGIGTLAALLKRVRKRDGDLKIRGLRGIVKEMFAICDAERVFLAGPRPKFDPDGDSQFFRSGTYF